MVGFLRRVFGIFGFLPALHMLPANAEPFFITVYGRTYKIDPGRSLGAAMKPLPSDIAKGPASCHRQQVLGRGRGTDLDCTFAPRRRPWKTKVSPDQGRNSPTASADPEDTTQSLGAGAAHSPALKMLHDRYVALDILGRELRRYMGVPLKPSGPGQFTRPKLSPELEASYRDLKFDPMAAFQFFGS